MGSVVLQRQNVTLKQLVCPQQGNSDIGSVPLGSSSASDGSRNLLRSETDFCRDLDYRSPETSSLFFQADFASSSLLLQIYIVEEHRHPSEVAKNRWNLKF